MRKINKKFKKIFLSKFVILGVLPFLLIAFWFVSSLLFNNKISFSVLLYKHSQSDVKHNSSEKLLKGKEISGEFKAKDNYLGIVMIRFDDFVKPDSSGEDILAFRLKEKGKKDWYYFNNYRSGLLKNNLLFPFGFPIINDSEGKTYEFEIESLFGSERNAVEVDEKNLDLLTGYQFPIYETFLYNNQALDFLIKKSITSFTNIDFLLASILYLLPLVIYIFIIILSPWWRKNKKFGYLMSGFILFFIFLDIFLIKEVYLGILIFLILGWILCAVNNKFNSRINFFFSFLLLFVWVILILFKIEIFQNKINIWSYTFLIIGLISAILEEKKHNSK